jgi:hypothetical protein
MYDMYIYIYYITINYSWTLMDNNQTREMSLSMRFISKITFLHNLL